eukprot:scaffold125816_cov57-Phaeocystis_antarctica.AAC.2
MLPLSARRTPRIPRRPATAGHAHLRGVAREELLLLRPGRLTHDHAASRAMRLQKSVTLRARREDNKRTHCRTASEKSLPVPPAFTPLQTYRDALAPATAATPLALCRLTSLHATGRRRPTAAALAAHRLDREWS